MVDHVDVSALSVEPIPPEPALDTSAVEPHVRASAVLNGDLRLAALERRIDDNDWGGIARDLGPLDAVGTLPANLGLLAALAHNEVSGGGDQQAVAVGIRCIANILGLPEHGAIARVIGRRLFRRNPVRFAERKAPTARVSSFIILATLVLGSGAGWLASGGWGTVLRLVRPLLHH